MLKDNEVSLLQKEADELMDELENINFSDIPSLLAWWKKMEDPSDHISIKVDKQKVVKLFEEHGFFVDENVNKENNDPIKFSRYLIGQCLDFFKSGYSPWPVLESSLVKEKCRDLKIDL